VGLKKKTYCLLSALDKTRMSKDDNLGVEVYSISHVFGVATAFRHWMIPAIGEISI
jgi:hypothetical protein